MQSLIRIRKHFIKDEDNKIVRTIEFTNTDSWDSYEALEDQLFLGDDPKVELFSKISEYLELCINDIENAFYEFVIELKKENNV